MLKNDLFCLIILIIVDLILLFYTANNISISSHEADIFFNQNSFLHHVVNTSTNLLGQSDLAIRVPFIIIHVINIFLLHEVSKSILNKSIDRFICILIYMFLPGVLTSAIVVNYAGFIILFTLFVVYFIQHEMRKSLIVVLLATLLVKHDFIIIYITLIIYGLYFKKRFELLLGIVFSIVAFALFDLEIGGKPKGYILDTFGVFATTFSPFIFMYFIYTLYRIWVKEKKDFLWFVSTVAFCSCVLLSIRQKPALENFLPYCVILIPHMVRIFFVSYRVRLSQFRTKYNILAFVLVCSLLFYSMFCVFHEVLYLVIKEPKHHFIYKYDVAKELAGQIKELGFNSVKSDKKMELRLKFYGIQSGNRYYLTQQNCKNNLEIKNIKINKLSKEIANFYLCKNI